MYQCRLRSVSLDQKRYITKVDAALIAARDQIVGLLDAGIEATRTELAYQHGQRRVSSLSVGEERAFLMATRRARRLRADHLPKDLFSDPAWDILLELTLAQFEHRQVTVKELQIASSAPSTTTLRWLRLLEDRGIVQRCIDTLDHRRSLVSLSEKGRRAMSGWIAAIAD